VQNGHLFGSYRSPTSPAKRDGLETPGGEKEVIIA